MNKYAGVQPSEIDKYFTEKDKRLFDGFGWTGEFHLSAKDVLDFILESQPELPVSAEEVKELVNAVKELYPHCHESDMKGESNYERAWLRVEKALKAMESYRNPTKGRWD